MRGRLELTFEIGLRGDRRIQRQIEGLGNRLDGFGDRMNDLGDRMDELGERLGTITDLQGRNQRQLGEIIALSTELYRVQLANQRELRDLMAVVRRNQDIINQPMDTSEEA